MMNLVTSTVQIAFVAFLAWGGMLSLRCLLRGIRGNMRVAG